MWMILGLILIVIGVIGILFGFNQPIFGTVLLIGIIMFVASFFIDDSGPDPDDDDD